MSKVLLMVVLASFAITSQAIAESAILDQTYATIVEIPSLKREQGQRRLTVQAFGNEFDLDLHKTDDLLPTNLPVYVYGEDENGTPTMDDWTHRTDSVQSLYTDKKTGASVMIEDIDGETRVSGMLTDDLIIEPPPLKLANADLSEQREKVSQHHLVSRVKRQQKQVTPYDYVVSQDKQPELGEETPEKREAIPEKLYVPVQVVVDYALWKKLNKPEGDVIKYIKQFYNSVNLLYRPLSWPSVSVSIYGITICKTAQACKMIETVKVDSQSVNGITSLKSIAKYAYAQRPVIGTKYALMMVMTGIYQTPNRQLPHHPICQMKERFEARFSQYLRFIHLL